MKGEYYDINWVRLKHRCPVNIARIVVLAIDMERELRNIDDEKNPIEELKRKIVGTRGALNILCGNFLDIARAGLNPKDNVDMYVYLKIEFDTKKILKNLSAIQDAMMRQDDKYVRPYIIEYKGLIETVLYGIYYSIEAASEAEPKVKKDFLYALGQSVGRRSGIFGSIVSETKTGVSAPEAYDYKQLLGDTGVRKEVSDAIDKMKRSDVLKKEMDIKI